MSIRPRSKSVSWEPETVSHRPRSRPRQVANVEVFGSSTAGGHASKLATLLSLYLNPCKRFNFTRLKSIFLMDLNGGKLVFPTCNCPPRLFYCRVTNRKFSTCTEMKVSAGIKNPEKVIKSKSPGTFTRGPESLENVRTRSQKQNSVRFF